jgi:hypothetical protein
MYFCVVLCIFVLFYVLFVLCRSLYCLGVYVCTELLPPSGYPIAVKYIISYQNPHGTNGRSCLWNVRKETLQSTFNGFAMYVSMSQYENCMKFGTGGPKMRRISVKLDNNNVHLSQK